MHTRNTTMFKTHIRTLNKSKQAANISPLKIFDKPANTACDETTAKDCRCDILTHSSVDKNFSQRYVTRLTKR